jgi:anti-anti-sigma factor
MIIEIESTGDRCILRFKGQFHAGANLEYLCTKSEEIKALNPREILADLREVISMGSSAIGFIVGLYTSVTKKPGGRFMMAGANARVREVFTLTRLDTIIPSSDTVESALAAFGK